MPTKRTDTEQVILEAAHEVFTRHGTHATLLKDVAEEAGVNQALLHYYFRSKEKLARAVFERACSGMFPQVREILCSDTTLEEKVEQIVNVYLEFFQENPYLPGYVMSEVNTSPERVKQMFESVGAPLPIAKVQEQIEARVEAGTLRPIAAEHFFVNLFSLCIMPFVARPIIEVALEMDEERFAPFIEERKKEITRFFLDAITPC